MNDIKVSVVLPIYNVEKYLNRCVESVVQQTYQNLEIILVDDGSPDGCPALCDEWAKKDSRIQVVHKTNAGLGMARNTGIDHATGKYIFFFDTDDYVDTTIVEKCVNSAVEQNADVVIYGRNDVYEDGRVVENPMKVTKTVFGQQEIINELLPAMFTYDMGFGVSAWGKMFNLETFQHLNQRFFSEREIVSEDAYFSLEFFSRIQTATIVNENLYFYLKRENSLSRTYRTDRLEKNNDFYQRSMAYMNQNQFPEKVKTHVAVRYQMYMIAAMKQVLQSTFTKEEKQKALRAIMTDSVLHSSITANTLSVNQKGAKLFWWMLKRKWYVVCECLLRYKTKS